MGSKLTKQKKKNLEEGKELEKGGGYSSGTWPRNKKPDFSDQKSATLGRGRKGDGANTLERRQSFGKRFRASARNFAANRGFIDPCKSPQACGGHSRSEAPTKPSSVILGENEAKAEAVEEMVVKADEVQENAAHNDVSLVVKELVEEAILKKSREKLNEGDDQKVEARVEEPVKIEDSGLVEIDSNTAITTEVQPAENVSQFLSQKSVCEEDVTPIAEIETNDEIVIATKEDGVEEEEETPCIENLQHAQISLVATTEVAEVLEREETPEISETAVEDVNETPVQVQIEAEEMQESVLLVRKESAPVEIETTEAIVEPIKEAKDEVFVCFQAAPESSTPIEVIQEDTLIIAEKLVGPPIEEFVAICDPITEAASNEPQGAAPESSTPIEVIDVQEDTLIVAEKLVGPPIEEFVAICDFPIAEAASNEPHEAAPESSTPLEVTDVEEDTLIVAEKLVAPPAEELVMVCDPVAISNVIHEASEESIKQENTIVEKQEEKVVVCSFGTNEGAETVSELIERETTVVESRQEKVIVCTTTLVEKQEEKIVPCLFGFNEPPVQIENEIETKVVEAEQVEAKAEVVERNETEVVPQSEREVEIVEDVIEKAEEKIVTCNLGFNEPPVQIENEIETKVVEAEQVEGKAEAEVVERNETEVVPQSEREVEIIEEVIEKVEEEQSEQPVEEVVTKDVETEKVDNAIEQIVTENVDKEVERVDEDVDNMIEQEIKVESIEVVGIALLTEAEKIAKDIIDTVVAEASDDSDTEDMVEEVVKEVIDEVVKENEEAGDIVSESIQAVQTNEERIEGNEEPVLAIEASIQTIDEVSEAAEESVHADEKNKNVISTDEGEVNPKECESSEAVTEDIIVLNNVEVSKTINTECASNAVKDTIEEKAADAVSDAGSDDGSERTDVSTDEGIAASSDDEKCNEGKDITAKEKVSKNAEDVTQTVETSA